MFNNSYYNNFVKPTEDSLPLPYKNQKTLSGDEAKQIYLKEIETASSTCTDYPKTYQKTRRHKRKPIELSDKEIFLAVENNDRETLKLILNQSPDKIHLTDSYGWTLLMIACQANAAQVAKELLKHGIDTTVRDKAGNSARSLVIKNNNIELCNILLDHRDKSTDNDIRLQNPLLNTRNNKEFTCSICKGKFEDQNEHLSSTVHNLHASKGRKFMASYKIPFSNRGYQIMVKSGWDRNTGLGRDGTGKMYPIKTEQKKDRKGLGNKNKKTVEEKPMNQVSSKTNRDWKRKEINFRRDFY